MERWLQWILVMPIRIYQYTLSPVLSRIFGMRCRYDPTCSEYMAQSIYEWGPIKGLWLGLKRIGRCHPWGGFGNDPVPKNPKINSHAKRSKKKRKE